MLAAAILLVLLALLVAAAAFVWLKLRGRGLDRWIVSYAAQTARRWRKHSGPIHVLLCIADHFEPKQGDLSPGAGRAALEHWLAEYPKAFASFRDSDGLPPRHTYFYPEEEYEADYLDGLADLCRRSFGEVEIHLHHDHDTADGLRRKLIAFRDLLAERHGLLARDRCTGAVAYGFIHGNWALDNSLPDGRWCGVNNELDILRETGCYADFTLPSAPSPAQTRKINSIYYAVDDPTRPKSHDWGVDVGTGAAPERGLMLIQGPLVLDWRRSWRLFPRIENSCIQRGQEPDMRRLGAWLKARVQVPNRPEWFFVKLHAHGLKPANTPVLLGEPMQAFHRALAKRAAQDANFHFHYVTAREMYNLARAAESGWIGSVADARDSQFLCAGQLTGLAPSSHSDSFSVTEVGVAGAGGYKGAVPEASAGGEVRPRRQNEANAN